MASGSGRQCYSRILLCRQIDHAMPRASLNYKPLEGLDQTWAQELLIAMQPSLVPIACGVVEECIEPSTSFQPYGLGGMFG